MQDIYQLPKKVKFIMELQLGIIDQFYPRKGFIGGRIGYAKEEVFKWLLIKKLTNWGYRTIAELAHLSAQTLCRRDEQFRVRGIYEKFFQYLVKQAVKTGLIKGKKVALDGSFVATYSGKEVTRGIEAFTKNAYLALICYALNKLFLVGVGSF